MAPAIVIEEIGSAHNEPCFRMCQWAIHLFRRTFRVIRDRIAQCEPFGSPRHSFFLISMAEIGRWRSPSPELSSTR
jgi:hypothetical protein